jgi:hypothetical protein
MQLRVCAERAVIYPPKVLHPRWNIRFLTLILNVNVRQVMSLCITEKHPDKQSVELENGWHSASAIPLTGPLDFPLQNPVVLCA